MRRCLVVLSIFYFINTQAQITINNALPYNTSSYLVDNVLLGGGIVGSNHSFIGDANQIGFFNGVNSNVSIDSGVVLSSGSILELVGPNASGSTSTSFSGSGDPTLDLVVGPIDFTNDAAVLEFDFVPTSDVISFKYVFGSEEYLEFVASFNDAFGFFLSGPNPTGGMYVDENLAIVPGTVNTPVSIFNVNNVSNPTYYIDNGDGFTAPQNTDPTVIQFDGFTTPLTATAAVNCGDTYHIKIVVADVNDHIYDSGVFLEAGSFYSPPLTIVDDLGIDSLIMNIPCNGNITLTANAGVGATYEWFDSTSTVFSTNASIIVGEGIYVVSADISGCAVISDTLRIIEADFPIVNLGVDLMIPCNSDILIDPLVTGGTAPYSYLWDSGNTDSMMVLSEGVHSVVVTDIFGCSGTDALEISYDTPPVVDLGGDYNIACNTTTNLSPIIVGGTQPYSYLWSHGSTDLSVDISEGNYVLTVSDLYGCSDSDEINIIEDVPGTVSVIGGEQICSGESSMITFDFDGLLPWELVFSDGNINRSIPFINSSNFIYTTLEAGLYSVVEAKDINGCVADNIGSAEIIVNSLPTPIISPNEGVIYEGEQIELSVGAYAYYEWYSEDNSLIDTLSTLIVSDSGIFYVWVMDANGCADISSPVIIHIAPLTQLFIPSGFTPNNDEHNELFIIKGEYIESFNIKIFNSWGEKLFESNQIDKYWDGTFKSKKVQQDTYYYNIEVVGEDGNLLVRSGNVKVIY